jgi:putative membrane protein
MKKNLLKLLCLLSLGVFIASPALEAKDTNGAEDFVKTASMANEFEIESSRLALDKSQNTDVRRFAQQMIDDHEKAGKDLQAAVQEATVSPESVTQALDDKHQKIMGELREASGKDFNEKYVKVQTKAHKDAVSLFKHYSKDGEDKTLKEFASKTLPTLERHLTHVKEVKKSL